MLGLESFFRVQINFQGLNVWICSKNSRNVVVVKIQVNSQY